MKSMSLRNSILILIACLIATEGLTYLVHQAIMGAPYLPAYAATPAFFVIFETVFCIMSRKSLMHGKNTRWFAAFKMIKMLFAVAFIGTYLFLTKTEGSDMAMLVRFFIEYLTFLVAETYIGTSLQIQSKANENSK